MNDEVQLILGGPQGAGLETTAQVLTVGLTYLGYGVISDREYFSNIKGRHSYVHTRISVNEFPRSLSFPVDLIGGMDAETIFTHFEDLKEGGYLIYDVSTANKSFTVIPSMEKELKHRLMHKIKEFGITDKLGDLIKYLEKEKEIKVVSLDFPKILSEARKQFKLTPSQASRYISTILVGAVSGLLGLEAKGIEYGLMRRFEGKEEIIENNKGIFEMVANIVKEQHGTPLKLGEPKIKDKELMVVTGNDITAMGKIVGGLRFQSYYPITPAADESFLIEEKENLTVNGENLGGIVVFQTEDELAAITAAIGAALAGARSATATSGPGFSLMAEAIGWAGINEVPVVITYYQRGGPSTGLPTRGSQSDLLFTLFASHGEFPRIVLASGDHTEAFYDAIDAFNLAEKYQLPVIHLLDKFLANSFVNMRVPDLTNVNIDRGKIIEEADNYKRFDLSEPISPRAFLGSKTIAWYTGDEHDEFGHISEDPENRIAMFNKRMKKLEIADKEIPVERRVAYYGSDDAEFLLVGWGFTKGVALDAIKDLESKGIKGAYLHIRMFIPFPSNYVESIIKKFDNDKVIPVEHSYEPQVAQVIKMNTRVDLDRSIVKYTGRPIYRNELVDAIDKILKGERRVVLSYGA